MTNQSERPVSILLRIGIFLIPGIFAWFTLRKGYSSLARILSFLWLIIGLYAAYPLIKKEAEAIPIFFGFLPEHVKAQQCLTVSRFLPSENEASIWREASDKRISHWLKYQSGCVDPIGCMEQRQALSSFVELSSAPDGNSVSRDIIKKWMNSDYCQTLVASYRNALSIKTQAASKMTESIKPDVFRIKLYFERQGSGNELYEAIDFQKNKVATFCYDTDELNNIKLEGASNKNFKLVLANDDGVFFEKNDININTGAIFHNKEIKIEPGPTRFQIKVLQGDSEIFRGNIESEGCS